jgi:hypothetical protein
MKMSVDGSSGSLVLSDPKLAALSIAIGGRLERVQEALGSRGRLEFHISGVPADLPEQVLNDSVQVSARRFIDAMEGVLALIAQKKRVR